MKGDFKDKLFIVVDFIELVYFDFVNFLIIKSVGFLNRLLLVFYVL